MTIEYPTEHKAYSLWLLPGLLSCEFKTLLVIDLLPPSAFFLGTRTPSKKLFKEIGMDGGGKKQNRDTPDVRALL
jgi:hypothetical protein